MQRLRCAAPRTYRQLSCGSGAGGGLPPLRSSTRASHGDADISGAASAACGALIALGGALLGKRWRRLDCEEGPSAQGSRRWIRWGDAAPAVRVLTWNVLTDQVVSQQNEKYVKDYEADPSGVCSWERRLPLMLAEITKASPDVMAFQEVSQRMWQDLRLELHSLGYDGSYHGYLFGWLNSEYGVAVFWRVPWMALACNHRFLADHDEFLAACPLQYQQQPHWAVAACLIGPGGQRLAVSSVHPTWKGPEQVRIAQATAAVAVAHEAAGKAGESPADVPVIICGDFNTISDYKRRDVEHYSEGPVMHKYLTTRAGLQDALTYKAGFAKDAPSSFTFAIPPGRRDEVIDFIFHSPGLIPVGCLQLDREATLQGRPYLPHAGYPSDHVHLVCDLAFL